MLDKKSLKSHLLILTIILIGFCPFRAFSSGSGGNKCLSSLEGSVQSKDPLTRSDQVELQLKEVMNKVGESYSSNPAMNKKLEVVLESATAEILKVQEVQDRLLSEELVETSELQSLEQTVTQINNNFNQLVSSKAKYTEAPTSKPKENNINDIIAEPKDVQAELVYKVDLPGGESLNVVFSEKIVKEVFEAAAKTRFLSVALSKIQKGIFGGSYSGDGVIRLRMDSSVLEIRNYGKHGKFRFYGYLHEGVFHIVAHTFSSNHGSYLNQVVDQVHSQRSLRGH